MLILTREIGESIMIGDEIVITVKDIDRNRVVLGIRAPKHIPVNREEVHESIEREKQGLPPLPRKRFRKSLE